MPLHLEKKAIRALGVAESFRAEDSDSTLVGVVMRSDLVVDGLAIDKLTVSGSDALKSIVKLFSNLARNDINVILLSGSILSLYNIVDVDAVNERLRIPVVAITFTKSKSDLERNIRARFGATEAIRKLRLLRKLGAPEKIRLKTNYPLFVRPAGINVEQAKNLLDRFTLQGAVPEPIRVARLAAKTVTVFRRREKAGQRTLNREQTH